MRDRRMCVIQYRKPDRLELDPLLRSGAAMLTVKVEQEGQGHKSTWWTASNLRKGGHIMGAWKERKKRGQIISSLDENIKLNS